MKAKRINSYPKNGRTINVYEITSATPEQLELYADIQGENYRVNEESGRPLFFYREDFASDTVELQFNRDKTGVYVANNQVQKLKSATESLGNTTLGQAFAQLSAQQLMAQLLGTAMPQVATPAPIATPQPVVTEQPITDEAPFTE